MPGNNAQAWSLAWADDQAGPAGSSSACTAGLDPTRPKKERKRTETCYDRARPRPQAQPDQFVLGKGCVWKTHPYALSSFISSLFFFNI